MPLSERAQQLIPKARIISFADWPYQQAAIAIWQQADDQTRYLSDSDLDTLVNLEPDLLVSSQQARKLRDNATFIVDNARAMISGLEALKQYSLEYFSDSEKAAITPYFDHLITVMKKF
jgi:hypothetical protein